MACGVDAGVCFSSNHLGGLQLHNAIRSIAQCNTHVTLQLALASCPFSTLYLPTQVLHHCWSLESTYFMTATGIFPRKYGVGIDNDSKL